MTIVTELESLWPDSIEEPRALFESDDPAGEAGTYVIEPGERVPESGTSRHDGTEVSVVLEGELRLVTDEEYHLGPKTILVVPAGVEHYGENVGGEPARLVYAIFGEL